MIARIRAKTEEEQTIKEHSEHVAQLAAHSLAGVGPVSYTHLDVYKRQGQDNRPSMFPHAEWHG